MSLVSHKYTFVNIKVSKTAIREEEALKSPKHEIFEQGVFTHIRPVD
jgi:hypothetical protein